MFGNADILDVRTVGANLLAGPAGGAFLLTGLGAEAFAHVLDAPARRALRVLVALVKEAPFPRFAERPQGLGTGFESEQVEFLPGLRQPGLKQILRSNHFGRDVRNHGTIRRIRLSDNGPPGCTASSQHYRQGRKFRPHENLLLLPSIVA